jgi:hypothetical protein
VIAPFGLQMQRITLRQVDESFPPDAKVSTDTIV